jgi:hypothetical protein
MKKNIYLYAFSILFVSLMMLTGCASASHRDATGVLKSETRTNLGVYKGNN